jgi:hypothetical protein
MPDNKPNDNDFGQRLGRIVLKRLEESEKKFKYAVEDIAKNVEKSIKDEEYEQTYDFQKALKECENYAEIYAAASYLHDYIFNGNKTCNKIKESIDFDTKYCSEWNRDHQIFRKKIKEILEEEEKDLVYIFWSSRLEVKYFYVGLTHIGSRRFEERRHDNAPVCSKEAEKFTIIYLSSKIYLEKVEACIIRVFGLRPEKEPQGKSGIGTDYEKLKYNDIYPSFPNKCELHESYNELKKLVKNFRELKKEYYKRLSELEDISEKLSDIENQIYQI